MPKKLTRLKVDEVSLVTRGANPDAHVVLTKRLDDPFTDAATILSGTPEAEFIINLVRVTKDFMSFDQIFGERKEREKAFQLMDEIFRRVGALQETFDGILMDDKTPEKAAPLIDAVKMFQQSIATIDADAVEKIAKFDPADDESAPTAGATGTTPSTKEASMPGTKKSAGAGDNTGTVTDTDAEILKTKLDETNAALEKALAIAAMNDVQKAHFGSLDEDGQAAFIKLSADERKVAVEKAAEADETIEYEGEVVRKSECTPGMFAMMKKTIAKNLQNEEKIAKQREDNEVIRLAKVADDKYPNLPGTDDERGRTLLAISKMDDTERSLVERALGAAAGQEIFKEAGRTDAENEVGDDEVSGTGKAIQQMFPDKDKAA